jgi:hypothetical protein
MKDVSYMTPSSAFVTHGCRKMRKERESELGAAPWSRASIAVNSRLGQAVLAIQWLWSLRRLWVVATNRHSDCAAALPLRMNLSIRRLYLICP